MTDIFKFLFNFLNVFMKGIIMIVTGIVQIFNLPEYFNVFSAYSDEFSAWQWIVAILFLLIILAILVGVIWIAVHFIRKAIRLARKNVVSGDLLKEINSLNKEIERLNAERKKLFDLKLEAGGLPAGFLEDGSVAEEEKILDEASGESRFYKLNEVELNHAYYVAPEFENVTMSELCDRFRNFACSKLRLFYDIRTIRLFWSALATTRLLILQGISGTGKTSLAYAAGEFLQNKTTICPVQPSWRDRTEIFGYFNEFTKRFNETEVLKKMYEATLTEDTYFTVLDEMNIARVEYYFAELLSIFEMPTRDNWVIDLVPSGWDSDPKNIVKGRFTLPQNMWFIGTANNDDSTFAISDKVYDRAIPININSKGTAFDAPPAEPVKLNYKHLEAMFKEAKVKYKVSAENLKKIEQLDDYVIQHFRLAFGNRIVKQLNEFVPVYVDCGGTELDGLDYVLCNKILRKFESLNMAYIRDEVDGLIDYMNKLFGKANMTESKEYLLRLKKLF